MKYLILTILLITFSGCISPYQTAPPPGVERGETWPLSDNFGYDEPIYTTPDLLPQPKKGTGAVLKKIQARLENTPCAKTSRITFMIVIDEKGEVMGVHPTPLNGEPCEQWAISEIKSYSFYPAEFEGALVKSVFALSASFR